MWMLYIWCIIEHNGASFFVLFWSSCFMSDVYKAGGGEKSEYSHENKPESATVTKWSLCVLCSNVTDMLRLQRLHLQRPVQQQHSGMPDAPGHVHDYRRHTRWEGMRRRRLESLRAASIVLCCDGNSCVYYWQWLNNVFYKSCCMNLTLSRFVMCIQQHWVEKHKYRK